MRLVCIIGLLLASIPALSSAGEPTSEAKIAAWIAELDSNDFARRQTAETKLIQLGRQSLDAALADRAAPQEGPIGTDFTPYFDALETRIEEHLERELFRHVPAGVPLEAQFRLERIRATLASETSERLNRLRAKYPVPIPEDQAKRVHGYTGGFRDDQPWFDAKYRNGSTYAITAVRVLVRLTHKTTSEKSEQEIILSSEDKPLLPGREASWSAKVDRSRSSEHNFYWQTQAVYGYPTNEPTPAQP
jgi:hypothetical protein